MRSLRVNVAAGSTSTILHSEGLLEASRPVDTDVAIRRHRWGACNASALRYPGPDSSHRLLELGDACLVVPGVLRWAPNGHARDELLGQQFVVLLEDFLGGAAFLIGRKGPGKEYPKQRANQKVYPFAPGGADLYEPGSERAHDAACD